MRILIIGDKEGSREGLAFLLKNEGYGIEVARDAIEAKRKLGQAHFDLIVSDLEVNDQIGIELSDDIEFTNSASLIIVLTECARTQKLLQRNTREIKVFLEKPIDPSELLQVVKKFKKNGRSVL